MIFYLLVIILVVLVVMYASGTNKVEKVGGDTNADKFTIYYAPDCKYCLLALELLRDKRANYTAIKIDDFPALLQKMRGMVPSTHKTKPIIFHNGKFLGGYTDLAKFYGVAAV
jgi:glutaredoxin